MESHNLCDQQAGLYHAPQKAEQSGRDRRAGCTVLEMALNFRPQARSVVSVFRAPSRKAVELLHVPYRKRGLGAG